MNRKSKSHKKFHKKSHKRTHKKYYTRRRLHKKQNDIVSLPGSAGVPIFSNLNTIPSKQNYINTPHKQSGNIINGLRNYYEKKSSLI